MLIPKSYNVIAIGTKEDGTFVWAMMQTSKGDVPISSMYAPNVQDVGIDCTMEVVQAQPQPRIVGIMWQLEHDRYF